MADLKISLKKLLDIEKGYSNHPDDTGGETYAGISRNNHPNWDGWKIIDAIQDKKKIAEHPEVAKKVNQFYELEYWNKIMGNFVNNQDLADEMLDCCVNMGIKIGITFIQRAINAINDPDIEVDSKMGDNTMQKLNSLSPKALLALLRYFETGYYLAIVERNSTQKIFLKGWLNRV